MGYFDTVLDLLQVYLDPKWHTAIMDLMHVDLLNADTTTLLAGQVQMNKYVPGALPH